MILRMGILKRGMKHMLFEEERKREMADYVQLHG